MYVHVCVVCFLVTFYRPIYASCCSGFDCISLCYEFDVFTWMSAVFYWIVVLLSTRPLFILWNITSSYSLMLNVCIWRGETIEYKYWLSTKQNHTPEKDCKEVTMLTCQENNNIKSSLKEQQEQFALLYIWYK